MTFNRHLLPWLYASSFVAMPACDFSKSLGSVDDGGTSEDAGTECPADARLCPDGSPVGREGPDCEFAPCPGEDTGGEGCTLDAKICPDGSAVGREGPECEFAPCPGDTGGVACTDDGKICPDGTTVGRQGPECEFSPCPSERCNPDDCGPIPGTPNYDCEDGSVGGPLCLPDAAGVCGWTIRECSVACPADARICADGTSVVRRGPDCAFMPCPGECAPSACEVPVPDVATSPCTDGSLGRAYCAELDDGTCEWSVRCEYACDGDARTCPDGTVVGRVGPDCQFADCPTTCDDEAMHVSPAGCPAPDVPVLPVAGCYVPCETAGEACEDGGVCTVLQTHPCDCAPGVETCCDACAETSLLCVPEITDADCSLLIGHTFVSVDEHECGETPDGTVSCPWRLSFAAETLEWRHSDVVELLNYRCDGGVIMSSTGYEGAFDAATGALVWNDVDYAVVQ